MACWRVGALAALLTGNALAQPPQAEPVKRPDPLDASAPVPAALHRSVFSGYRTFGDVALCDWKQANGDVARVGGWRTYLREKPEAPLVPATGCARP